MAPRYLLAPDSFKGTFSATEVAAAMARGVRAAGREPVELPLADGGEGTAAALLAARGGTLLRASAHDPLRRPITAEFALLGDGRTAVVEVAAASGLPLLGEDELDAERADSYGTGELIAAAATAGARTILVAAGGSATTDGGGGAIVALLERGWRASDDHGVGNQPHLEVICDVTTTFEDAARVFAPQKGADELAVARLNTRLQQLATTLPRDPRGAPMSGAAGGLSGGLLAAFDATLCAGAPFVLDQLGFDAKLASADAVLTGEGRIDSQSLVGKLVGTVAERCAGAGVPLTAIVGKDELERERASAAGIAAVTEATTLAEIEAVAQRIADAGPSS
jgi:glycerate 2-kinase